jgi:hypothetical protein
MDRRMLFGIGALAAAALLLETTLTRLLAVAQYYHFAFLVISLALLGFGAGGTALAVSSRLLSAPADRLLAQCGLAFAAATFVAYGVVNFLPFDSYRIAWEPRQILFFGLYYLALTLPFLCAGIGIGAALASGGLGSNLLYAANLFGSAAGVLLAPLLMALSGVPGAVLGATLIALAPAAAASGRSRTLARATVALSLAVLAALAVLNLAGRAPLGMVLSPYKGLVQALRFPGAQVIFGRWSAASRVDVVSDAGTRGLPGLSYTYSGAVPEQLGLSVDGESPEPITLAAPHDFAAAAYLPESAAFLVKPGARALVMEPGGGLGLLQALAGGASEITAVTAEPLAVEAVSAVAQAFDPYADARVVVTRRPPRVQLARDRTQYDVVFPPLTDAYRPVASGAYSLAETYDLTVEAIAASLGLLAPDGILVVTRWLQIPPSEELRSFATLVEALDRHGVTEPAGAIMAYRGIQTMTFLVRPSGWPAEAREAVRAFADARRYDLVWAPDLRAAETNRYNVMPEPVHERAFRDLLAAPRRSEYYATYPFAIAPATDDRPFFYNFFRRAQTQQVLATLGHTWQPFGGSGYLVLLALLTLVVLLSAVLVLAPFVVRRVPATNAPGLRIRVLAYFGLLGIAFLFVEVPLIQRHILVYGHAAFAFTAVVLVILVFSGIGSAVSGTYSRARPGPWLSAILALLTAVLGPVVLSGALSLPDGLREVVPLLALAPLAFVMGIPFPAGLAWLHDEAAGLIPWAWAVNGCASVIASVLAAIIALNWGLTAVILLGAGAYALAGLVLIGLPRSAARTALLPDS